MNLEKSLLPTKHKPILYERREGGREEGREGEGERGRERER